MASRQKRITTSKTGAQSKGQRTSGSKGKGAVQKGAQPQKRPYRRELGAVICLLLAFFGAIGYFKTSDGAFIALFCNLLKGLCGYGFYTAPIVLLLCTWILAFHRGRPVRLRVAGALAIPVLSGAVFHLLLCGTEYGWGADLFGRLWKDGLANTAGGVLGGVLAVSFQFAFSKAGAAVVFIILTIAAVLCTFRVTPADIVDFLRDRRDTRPEYDPDEYAEEAPARREPVKAPGRQADAGKKPVIDIPVDNPPVTAKEPTRPVTTVRKKSLFDKVAGTVSPDQVLTGGESAPVEESRPEYENVAELEPVMDGGMERPVPPAQPEPPVVVREPAVEKVSRQEAEAAQAEVTREIEEKLEREPQVYRYPPLSLLRDSGGSSMSTAGELQANQQRLQDTLQSFGVNAHIVNVVRGPSVTRYELELEQGVKLNKLTNLSDDIALSLGAAAVRVAPIPDKISTVGIEVPNRTVTPVGAREVLSSNAFTGSSSKVSFAVGKDIGGNCIVGDIARLPHMLIAGTTGSGKSVCTNSLIVSLLYKATPDEVRMIMVDPKMVELGVYNGIPHLLIPVVTDPKKAAGALQWAVNEMMKRYQAFSEVRAKDLTSYNNHARKEGKETMPQIVVVIDELADLMLVAAKEVEESICRVAQMGRASGMHLVIATQRPSSDVITGLMKANIPSRIAFAVASSLESRIILDNTGAEKLVGKGDMLYAPLGQGKPTRVQGCFISEEEVAAVVDFIKESGAAQYDESVIHEIERHAEEKEKNAKGVGGADLNSATDYDELLPAAIDVVLEVGQASVSMLQRRLKLGYGRAARLVDQMEEKGVVGPFEGSKPRQLLITKEHWQEMKCRQDMVDSVPEPEFSQPVPEEFPYEGDAVEQSREQSSLED